MTAFNGYPVSIVLALILHGLIIGAVLWMQRASTEVVDAVRPPAVKAILVEENPQTRNERVQQQEQQQLEQRRQEEQRQRQEAERRAQQERERQEAERREQERQATLEAQRERERRAAEQQRQAEQEAQRRREEQQRREAEQRRQEAQRQAAEQAAAAQREAERQAAAAAREQAETDAELVSAYTAVIHDLVQRNWSRPPSARNDMETVLRIRLVPTGEVVDVEVVRSSGDPAFDRAAENAVYAVGRFTELQGMPPRLFERHFRSLLLTFRPEDLRN